MLRMAVATAAFALIAVLPRSARAQTPTPSTDRPSIACDSPLPDPYLNAIALQAGDLPDGWQIATSCIVTLPPSLDPDALPSLQQSLLNFGALTNAAPSTFISGLLLADVYARNFPSVDAATAAFPAFVASAHKPAVDVAGAFQPGQPIRVPSVSVQASDLPAPAIGDDSAALAIEVTESDGGRTSTEDSTEYLVRRGSTIFSVEVTGGNTRDAVVMQFAEALDAKVQAAQAAGQ